MRPGELIVQRYEIISVAGSGGMGTVYRAKDRKDGATVAVKLATRLGENAERRFVREARILATLEHPAIVAYVGHGTCEDGAPYLVMEWLAGEDLAQCLERGPIGIRAALALGRRISEGLAAAHAIGIVHRDLKPANVFLVGGDLTAPKLIDFGIARGEATTRVTATGMIVGTAGYMAPEQILHADDVLPAADVYALGVLIFEAIVGALPYGDCNDLELLSRVIAREPVPRLSDFLGELPAPVDNLVAKLLAKDQADRPANGQAALALIDKAIRDLGRATGETTSNSVAVTATELSLAFRIVVDAPNADADGRARVLAAAEGALGGPSGVHVESSEGDLLDMSVRGDFSVNELAERAARAALRIQRKIPDARIRIAASRSTPPTYQRARNDPGGPAVELDDLAAALLEGRYEIDHASGGALLRAPTAERVSRPPGATSVRAAFVGRDRELRALLDAYEAAATEGTAHAVLLVGGPGTGKSRLVRELLDRVATSSIAPRVVFAQAAPDRVDSPFAVLGDALRATFGIRNDASDEDTRASVRGHVDRVAPTGDAPRVAAFLSALLGAADTADPLLASALRDPRLMAEQMPRAFEDWLGFASRGSPVLVLLDDLQWADGASVRAVLAAQRFAHDRPVFFAAFARPELPPRIAEQLGARGFEEIRLRPLARAAAERLVKSALGENVDPKRVAAIVAQAEGNPFALDQLVRTQARGDASTHEILMPRSLVALAEDRLRLLEPDARRVLRAASVLGLSFPIAAVEVLLGGAERDVDVASWCATLERKEILVRKRERRFEAYEELAFAHGLLRDAAEAMLPTNDRMRAHAAAGEWLESAGERDLGLIALHYERGGERASAARSYERAADAAILADVEGALRFVDRALGCGADGVQRGRLQRRRIEALNWLSLPFDTHAAGEALALLPAATEDWFRALGELAEAASYDSALVPTCLEALGQIPNAQRDSPDARISVVRIARAIAATGKISDAEAQLDTVGAIPEGEDRSRAWLARTRAMIALMGGDPAAAEPFAREASERFRRIGEDRQALYDDALAGVLLVQLGRLEIARRTLEASITVGAKIGIPGFVTCAQENLGLTLTLLDRASEADPPLEAALAGHTRASNPRGVAFCHVYLARAALARGEATRALERLAGVDDARAIAPDVCAYGDAVRAAALLALGKPDEALVAATAAHAFVAENPVEEGEAAIRLVYVQALDAASNTDAAVAALSSAVARLDERAAGLRDDGDRKVFVDAFPEHRVTLALGRERLVGVA